jgi:hypothetical protein
MVKHLFATAVVLSSLSAAAFAGCFSYSDSGSKANSCTFAAAHGWYLKRVYSPSSWTECKTTINPFAGCTETGPPVVETFSVRPDSLCAAPPSTTSVSNYRSKSQTYSYVCCN